MKPATITATVSTALALTGGGLAVWSQFENTELHDRLIDKRASLDTAEETCTEALVALARANARCVVERE